VGGNSLFGIQVTDLTNNEVGKLDDLFQTNGIFSKITEDGTIEGSYLTNFGFDNIEGIAYTLNYAYTITNFGALGNWLLPYNKLPFQDYMNYNYGDHSTKITLTSPDPNETTTEDINFTFDITSHVPIQSYSLLIDDVPVSTNEPNTILNGSFSFTYTPEYGEHTWSIKCENLFEKEVVSESRAFTHSQEPKKEDPLPEIIPVPEIVSTSPNPYLDTHGYYESIDMISNGTKLAVLFTDGTIEVYGLINLEISHIEPNIPDATGLTEVNPLFTYGASFAVSDANSITYIKPDGIVLKEIPITTDNPIDEITWDSSLNRLLIGTIDGIYEMAPDGVLTIIKEGNAQCIEAVRTSSEYFDWFAQNSMLYLFNTDGTWKEAAAGRDAGFGTGLKGMAFTKTDVYTTDGEVIRIYSNIEYLNLIDNCLYCADIYPDGVVGIQDLQVMAELWLYPLYQSQQYFKHDINCDGIVDLGDFALLAGQWMQ
ncbi:MAG: hypothetical protein KAS23_07990, partial [Anaerohalosphaera sp.]|nr:hypothetical protein [Anaerohalosphaera sp.]